MYFSIKKTQAWQQMHIIPAVERLKQEDHKFERDLGYRGDSV